MISTPNILESVNLVNLCEGGGEATVLLPPTVLLCVYEGTYSQGKGGFIII